MNLSKSIAQAQQTHNFYIDEIKQITACNGYIVEAPVVTRDEFEDHMYPQDSLEAQRKNLGFIFDTQLPEEIKEEVYGGDYTLTTETQTQIANFYVDKQMKAEMHVLKPDLSNDQEYEGFVDKEFVTSAMNGRDEWLDSRPGL